MEKTGQDASALHGTWSVAPGFYITNFKIHRIQKQTIRYRTNHREMWLFSDPTPPNPWVRSPSMCWPRHGEEDASGDSILATRGVVYRKAR